VFQVLLLSDNHKNNELDILVLHIYNKELMEGECASNTTVPSVSFLHYVPNERANGPSEAEILRKKYYVQFASHAAEPTDAPGVKFRPCETIFFCLPPKQNFLENAQGMTRLACRRKEGRGLKKLRVC